MVIQEILLKALIDYLDRNKMAYEMSRTSHGVSIEIVEYVINISINDTTIHISRYTVEGAWFDYDYILEFPDISNPSFNPDKWAEGIILRDKIIKGG